MPKGFSQKIRNIVDGIKGVSRPVLVEGKGQNFLPNSFGIDQNYQKYFSNSGVSYFINGNVPGSTDSEKNTVLADAIFETAIKGMIPAIQGTNAYIAGMMVKSFLANTLEYSTQYEKGEDGKVPFVLREFFHFDSKEKIATIDCGHKEIAIRHHDNGSLSILARTHVVDPKKSIIDNTHDIIAESGKGYVGYDSAFSVYPKEDGGFVAAQYDVIAKEHMKNGTVDAMDYKGLGSLTCVSKDGYVSKFDVSRYDENSRIRCENGEFRVSFEDLGSKEEGTIQNSENFNIAIIALTTNKFVDKSDELFEDAERYALTGKLAKEDDASQIEEQTDGMEQ